MLRRLNLLRRQTILAQDGNIGLVHDCYFEDDSWIVRYLVVDTGHWLPGRKVLLTPGVLLNPDWTSNSLHGALSKEQVEKSPPISTDLPVSRQKEIELHKYYGWLAYWQPAGAGPWPMFVPPPEGTLEKSEQTQKGDSQLRSAKEVTGYHLKASDGSPLPSVVRCYSKDGMK